MKILHVATKALRSQNKERKEKSGSIKGKKKKKNEDLSCKK